MKLGQNSPVLPACHQVGVFHQVAINILHVIAGIMGQKETLIKWYRQWAHAHKHSKVNTQFNHRAFLWLSLYTWETNTHLNTTEKQ